MLACAEEVLKRLGLPLPRRCRSAPATWASARSKTYDIEVWLPGQNTLSRDFVLLGLRRLPGAAHERALHATGRQGRPLRAHAERLGRWRSAAR